MININNLRVALFAASTLMLAACGDIDGFAQKNLYPAASVNSKYPVPETPPAGMEQIYFDLQDSAGVAYRAHAWFYTHPLFSEVNTLVYLHGNGENLQALQESNFLGVMKQLNVNFVVLDYPTYGRSTGHAEESTLVDSAKAAIDFAREKFAKNDIIVWGRSIGAGVASQAYAAKQDLAARLVLSSPWTNARDVAKALAGGLASQVSDAWWAKNTYNSEAAAHTIGSPVLIHHGTKDELVPVAMGRKMSTSFANPDLVKYVEFATRGHNDIFGESQMWQDIKSFSAR